MRMMLREIGFDDLVTQLRCAIAAREQGQKDLLDVSLIALATHPLIAGKHAAAETNGVIIALRRNPAQSRVGKPRSALGAEGDR